MNILQRLHKAMNDVDYVQKEKKPGMRYNIVSHDAVTAKVRPVLVKHGVVYYPVRVARTQDGNRTQVDATIRFCNIDDTNDFIDVESAGYGVDDQDKGPGKAISYAVKYALLKALGLETGDEPEYEDQEHKPANTQPAKPAQNANGADEKALRQSQERQAEDLKTKIKAATTMDALGKLWVGSKLLINSLPDSLLADVTATKDAQKSLLMGEAA